MGQGFRLVHDDGNGAACGNLCVSAGSGQGDQQFIGIHLGSDGKGILGLDGAIVPHQAGNGIVVCNDVDGAAYAQVCRGRAGRGTGRHGDHHHIKGSGSGLVVAALLHQNHAVVTQGGFNHILVGNTAHRHADTRLRGGRTERTGQNPHIGIVLGFQGHSGVLGLVTGEGDTHAPSQLGQNLILKEDHGHRPGNRGTGSAGCRSWAGHNRPGYRIYIVVGGTEYIQRIDKAQCIGSGDIDIQSVGAVFSPLVQVDKAGLCVGLFLVGKLGGIGNKGSRLNGTFKIAAVYTKLVCGDFQAFTPNIGVVADLHCHLVIAIDQTERCAHTGLGAFGKAHATGSDGKLGLIGSGNTDVAALNTDIVGLGGNVVALAVKHSHDDFGLGVVYHDGQRSGNGDLARSADGSCQGLGGQKSFVRPIHILGQVRFKLHISQGGSRFLRLLGGNIAGNQGDGFVAVYADGNGGGNGIGVSRLAHSHAGTQGFEIAMVGAENPDICTGNIARNGGGGLVVGDIQAHCRCHLEFLRPGGVHVGQLLRPGGIGLTHAIVGGAGGCGGIRTLGILCPQGIAGQGGVGGGLTAVGILVQCRIGVLLGLVLRLAAGIVAKVVSCHQLVGRGFGAFHALCHLIEIAVHVRTHGSGQCFAVVPVECECTNIHIPVTLNLAQHGVFHPGVHNIDGRTGTYCRRCSGCKGTGLGGSGTGPGGGNLDIYIILCSIHADLDIVVTGGCDSGVLADVAANHIIRNVQCHGGIQSHVLRGVLLFALGGGCQGVRSRHTGGLGIPDGICPHIQRTGPNNSVVTNPGHHFHSGAGHGEACAHAHGLSGGVSHRRGLSRVRGACLPECDLNVGVSVRHIEQVSRTAFSIYNGQIFHGNRRFFRTRHKFQGIQNEAVLCLDDDRQTIPCRPIERCLVCNTAERAVHFHQLDLALEGGTILNRIGVGVLPIGFLGGKVIRIVGAIDRDLKATHKVGPQFHRRLGTDIQFFRNTRQVFVQNHIDAIGGFSILGGCHILEDQSIAAVLVIKVNVVFLILEGQSLRCPAGIPIGQAQTVLGPVARVRSDGDQVAFHLGRYAVFRGLLGRIRDGIEFHLAVFPGVGFEYTLAGGGSLPGAGTGGGIGVIGTGTHIGIGLALAVFRRCGNGLFILVAQSTDEGILCHRKNLGVVFLAGCHNGRCLSLEDGQGHASGHGNFLGTGTGDGLGGEAVSRLPGRCLKLYIQQFGKGIQCRIGQCLSCGTEGRLHLFLDHRAVQALDKGHELFCIAQATGQLLAQVSGQMAQVLCHNGVKIGGSKPRNILGQYRAVKTGNGLQATVDDFRQFLHHQVCGTQENAVFPHQCRFDGLGESLGGQAAGVFVFKNFFQQRLGHVHNAAFQNARNGLPTLGL